MKKTLILKIKDGHIQGSKELLDMLKKFEWVEMKFDNDKPRTGKQNNALHLFCQKLAEALNDSGLDQRKVLKPSFNIPWDMVDVKEKLWRPIQLLVTKKESTKDLRSQEDIDKIHSVLMRELGEKHGVEYMPFPYECDECKGLSMHYEGCSKK